MPKILQNRNNSIKRLTAKKAAFSRKIAPAENGFCNKIIPPD